VSGIAQPILLDIPAAFVGERIVVRGWQDADSEAFYAAIRESAERISVWLPWPKEHQSVDDTRAYVRRSQARFALRELLDMGIFMRADGTLLGAISLVPHRWDVPSFEIGYWLRSSAEGQAYMSEAVRLLVTYCFETLDTQRLLIRCDVRNDRSRAIPERLGFRLEGTLRNDHRGTDSTLRDMQYWTMIPEEYARAAWVERADNR